MPFDSLGDFLAELQDRGELVRISTAVDSSLELPAIVDRVVKSSPGGGPALIFEDVKNSSFPVVANLLGSRQRLCRCLGVNELGEVTENFDRRLRGEQSSGWFDSFKLTGVSTNFSKWSPKTVKSAVCQQVVYLGRDVDLWALPVPRGWPQESHPVITAGLLCVNEPRTNVPRTFQSSFAVVGPQQRAWDLDRIEQTVLIKDITASQQNCPVAISLGGDPVLRLSTALPGVVDAKLLAGLLRGVSLETVRCRTNELEVPAGAEIIIEGYIDFASIKSKESISVARGNGSVIQRPLPLIQVTAVTHRANPVYPAMITALPPSEETWLGLAIDRIVLPVLTRQIPEIVNIHRPPSGAGRNLLFVSIRKTVEHQARRVLHALWGLESIGQTKVIVVVDADVNLFQQDQVWQSVATFGCPSRDFLFSDGHSRDDDYSPLSISRGSRVGIDATRKWGDEVVLPWPQPLRISEQIATTLRDRWSEYGLSAFDPG